VGIVYDFRVLQEDVSVCRGRLGRGRCGLAKDATTFVCPQLHVPL
jgi:hypothetical protein